MVEVAAANLKLLPIENLAISVADKTVAELARSFDAYETWEQGNRSHFAESLATSATSQP